MVSIVGMPLLRGVANLIRGERSGPSPCYPLYLPLSYVLFYAEGSRGYSQGMQLQSPTARGTSFPSCLLMVHANPFLLIGTPRVNNLLSISAFYRCHTYTRKRSFNLLHLCFSNISLTFG
jgi:hypothetical protein